MILMMRLGRYDLGYQCVKDSRTTPGCMGVSAAVSIHVEGGFLGVEREEKVINLFSNCRNFVIEKVHKVVTITGYRDGAVNCIVALC